MLQKVHFVCGILTLMSAGASGILLSRIEKYKDMKKAPNASSKIGIIHYSSTLSHCLLDCSKKDRCVSVVYEGTTCHLYNSIVGSANLIPGQKAVGQLSRESKYGKYRLMTNIRLCCVITHIQKHT